MAVKIVIILGCVIFNELLMIVKIVTILRFGNFVEYLSTRYLAKETEDQLRHYAKTLRYKGLTHIWLKIVSTIACCH